jgi:hypothetical protein
VPDRPTTVDDWIEQWPTESQVQVRWLAEHVHAADTRIAAAIKWHRLTFTVDDNWHHWLCAIAVTKRGVNLMFHKGALLADPHARLRGEGRYLRQLTYADAVTHPGDVAELVREAIAHQTELLPDP